MLSKLIRIMVTYFQKELGLLKIKKFSMDGIIMKETAESRMESSFKISYEKIGDLYEKEKVMDRKNNSDCRKKEGIEDYRKLAEEGDMRGQHNLGVSYYHGISVSKNIREAKRWFLAAANQGAARSQYNLGLMYDRGEGGIERNGKEAAHWYRKAGKQGIAEAYNGLGEMYDHGEGVKQSYYRALFGYRKAARLGYAEAQYNLGTMYYFGNGIKTNYHDATYWMRNAAEQGLAKAQYNLGIIYRDENWGDREAVCWLRKAAGQGFIEAQGVLAGMYYIGNCVTQNEKEAYIWLLIAQASGSKEANLVLQKFPWSLTSEEIQFAKRESEQRHAEIQNRIKQRDI